MSNLGLTFDELIDTLAYGHEIDFSYAGKNYVLMPDINEKNEWEYIVYQVLPRECKIVCVNRYCMNLLYAPYWGKQR